MSPKPAKPAPQAETMLGARLLEALAQVPASQGVVAVLRHSARDDITDVRDAPFVPLNAYGLEAARALGAALPKGRRLILRHSPIPRCQQTAEEILAGYGSGELQGADEGLGIPYVLDLDRLAGLAGHMGQREFAGKWFADELDPGVVQPAEEAARALATLASDRLRAAQPGELHLLVSHDWNVLLLRERLMGIAHGDVGWLDFLDGVVFAQLAAVGEPVSLIWGPSRGELR
jgi:broad specificity phosphatase PhoE